MPTLKTIMTGAASFPPDLANAIKEVIPHLDDIRIGYGLTESSPVVTLCTPNDNKQYRLTTVGRPIEYVETKIVDPNTGNIVEHNKEGELLVRGHNVMVGYFEDPERTKETLTADKWLKTGDVATMCEKGYIRISGRTKEMIIKGGESKFVIHTVYLFKSVLPVDRLLKASLSFRHLSGGDRERSARTRKRTGRILFWSTRQASRSSRRLLDKAGQSEVGHHRRRDSVLLQVADHQLQSAKLRYVCGRISANSNRQAEEVRDDSNYLREARHRAVMYLAFGWSKIKSLN